jgi:hypothetical protein
MTKVENSKQNMQACVCPGCPSYNDCAKKSKEALFCSIGKGKCHYNMNGCICMGCPVHGQYSLKAGYYCIKGSAQNE